MNIRNAEFVFALLGTAREIENRLSRVLSNVIGISYSEYFLLKQLNDIHGGAATRVDLASAVRLTPSAVTRALKPLEKLGYVSTEKGERDARQSIAKLTPAGDELLSNANSLVLDEVASLAVPRATRTELLNLLNEVSTKP